jgi:hypothetical protein
MCLGLRKIFVQPLSIKRIRLIRTTEFSSIFTNDEAFVRHALYGGEHRKGETSRTHIIKM